MALEETTSTFALKYVPDRPRRQQPSFCRRMQRNSLGSFLLKRSDPPIIQSQRPMLSDSLILLATAATRRTLYLSLCILLVSREQRSVTSFLQPAFSSPLLTSLPHSFCSLLLSHFFFLPTHLFLSSLTLSFHLVIDLSGSHLALCWVLLSKTPSSPFFSSLCLTFLSVFCLGLGYFKEYQKACLYVAFFFSFFLCVWP